MNHLRNEFPILANNPNVAYLDSAATAQKPRAVLDAVNNYLTSQNANAGRGSYPWANATTHLIVDTKQRVKQFLGDASEQSSVEFVSGTSEGLHRVALDWLAPSLRDGDEIIVPCNDHQANNQPWVDAVEVAKLRGVDVLLRPMPYDSTGDYDFAALADMISPRTALVAATHIHHVFGSEMQIARLRKTVGDRVPICLDAAQSVGHLPISLDDLDVDFLVFSGHKAMAFPGIGAVWSRNRRTDAFRLSGWQGTPNTAGVVSLHAAMDWLDQAGLDRIETQVSRLTDLLVESLLDCEDVELVGCPLACNVGPHQLPKRTSLAAFRHARIDSGDLGFVMASNDVMVRSNNHCQAGTQDADGSVRVSLHVYSTESEVERALEIIRAV